MPTKTLSLIGGNTDDDQKSENRIFDPSNPFQIAKWFVHDEFLASRMRTIHHYGGQFFAWDGHVYRPFEDNTVKALLYKYLDRAWVRIDNDAVAPFKPNSSQVGSIMDALRATSHLPTNVVNLPDWLPTPTKMEFKPPPIELLPCTNGLLHLPTLQLLPTTPAFFSTNCLPYAYDPEAPEPVAWLNFLDDLFGDDIAGRETLQEMFGYLLVPDTSLQKLFLIIGPKRSGKGTIGRALRGMLGQHNICGPTLASLSQNFGLAPLLGKLLAIVSDARLSKRSDSQIISERLLSISGEDFLTVDRKYLPAWHGQLFARILILTNEVPEIADASGAFASRFVLLRLTESFYGREDPLLTKRLLGELSGILNWAIEGRQRLVDRGHFVQPGSGRDAARELEELGSPIGTFVSERCNTGSDFEVAVDSLLRAYSAFCDERGLAQPPNAAIFGRDLRAAVPNIDTKQKRVSGIQVRHFTGIGLK